MNPNAPYTCGHGYTPEPDRSFRALDTLIGFVIGVVTSCGLVALVVWGMHG